MVARRRPRKLLTPTQAVEAVEADIHLMIEAAREMTARVRRSATRTVVSIDLDDLAGAAHAAGQMAMLARIAEQRLLCAVERRAGAIAVFAASSDESVP